MKKLQQQKKNQIQQQKFIQQQNYNYDYNDYSNQMQVQQYQDNQNYDYQYGNDNQYGDQYIEQQSNQAYNSFNDYSNTFDHKNKKQYQVIPYNSLFMQLIKNIKNTNQMTALPQGWCLLLLRQFKWDLEAAAEYFYNMEKYQKKIGYKSQYKNPNQINTDNKKIIDICQVCCAQNVILLQNICGHSFCIQCWKGQLNYAMSHNQPFQKCMRQQCQCPILYEIVLKFSKICFGQDRKIIDRYEKILCELFSSIHRNYQFCTGIDCNNCIKVHNLNTTSVRCTCGKVFCFKCKCDDHSPCTCDERKAWLESTLKQEADAKWMSVNTKLCPWCKKAVERSAGCNFMSCICGKSFCYLCSRPWQPDHKDHFKCHIYKKSQTQHVNRQKQILEKMNFYTQRFLDNQKIAEQNKKFNTFEKRKQLFKILKIDLSDSQFIDFSYKFSIQCCQTLKWINAYSYYVKWKNEVEKQKFQFYQGEFELHKVNLLKLLGIDLRNFFKQVQQLNKKGQINQTAREVLLQNFKFLKSSIVNYTTMTKKYKQKFIQEIQKQNNSQEIQIKKKNSKTKQKQENNHNPNSQISPTKMTTRGDKKKQSQTLTGKIVKAFKF